MILHEAILYCDCALEIVLEFQYKNLEQSKRVMYRVCLF